MFSQQLTAASDAVLATQERLPGVLRDAFQETIRPQLIADLSKELSELSLSFCSPHHAQIERDLNRAWSSETCAALKTINKELESLNATQQRIESCLTRRTSEPKMELHVAEENTEECDAEIYSQASRINDDRSLQRNCKRGSLQGL